MRNKILILINGDHQSGKDTFGSMLVEHLNKISISSLEKGDSYFLFKLEKFSNIPNEYFRQFTGINFLSLEGTEKQSYRSKFVNFCETMKNVFGKDFWAKKLKDSINFHYRSFVLTDFYFEEDLQTFQKDESIKIIKILINGKNLYNDFDTSFDYFIENDKTKISILQLNVLAENTALKILNHKLTDSQNSKML